MYDCHAGRCGKIEDWKCERRCADIESPGKNVIIMSGGYLLVMSSVYQVFLNGCKVEFTPPRMARISGLKSAPKFQKNFFAYLSIFLYF